MDDEFDNFLERVTVVESLVRQLRCSDQHVAERAKRRADQILGPEGKELSGDDLRLLERGDQNDSLRCPKERTVINYKAIERMADDPADMPKEAFMAQVEKDAENRARDRMERKQRSDELKKKGNAAFREKQYEKALDLFNKAIDETRDSAVLYENRALTCLHLELYQRAVNDCDWALRINRSSLKALLYKAKALHYLKEEQKSQQCLADAEEKHPQHQHLIREYQDMWMEVSQLFKKGL